jgi:hypothetical protein
MSEGAVFDQITPIILSYNEVAQTLGRLHWARAVAGDADPDCRRRFEVAVICALPTDQTMTVEGA